MEPTINDMMAAYAEDAVDYAKQQGVLLDYSRESIEKIEKIAGKLHAAMPKGFLGKLFRRPPSDAELDAISKVLGGYVGEVMRREKGGEWQVNTELNALGLRLADDHWVFPPTKAYKRIVDGPGDNIWSFYTIVVDHWDALTNNVAQEK